MSYPTTQPSRPLERISEKSLEHPPTLCVNRGTTNEQHTMSNTNTLIPEIIYSPELIQSAIEFAIASKTTVFVTLTVNDSNFTVYGTMRQKDGRVIVSDDYGLNLASFRLAQVEAVGRKCIWIKP